jgi:two-component system OmpR family response regulator
MAGTFHTFGAERSLVIRFGELTIDLISRRAERAGRALWLASREFDVLAYLVWYSGRAVSTVELRQRVWSILFDPETNSVAVHIHRLRRELDHGFPFPMLRSVRGEGYRIYDQDIVGREAAE